MKSTNIYTYIALFAVIGMLSACGPSEEEIERREQARQDSLERVQQQRMQEQRMDSLQAVRADSLEQAEQNEPKYTFDPEGNYAVQVAAWRSEVKASQMAQKWQDRGFENAFVVNYGNEETGNVWFRVRVGTLSDRQAARQLQQLLQENYQTQSWISYVQ